MGEHDIRDTTENDNFMAQLRLAQNGDQKAKEQLFLSNQKLIWSVVQRLKYSSLEREDLFQIGAIGLIKAIERFNPEFGVRFSTYAVPLIIGEIKRFLRDQGAVKIGRSTKELARKVQQEKEKLIRLFEREPTVQELATALGAEKEDILLALESLQGLASMHSVIQERDGDTLYLLDTLKDHKLREAPWFESLSVRDAVIRLPEKMRKVILLRYYRDKTQAEVAIIMGMSQAQVSRIEKEALALIQKELNG